MSAEINKDDFRHEDLEGYNSSFEDDEETSKKKKSDEVSSNSKPQDVIQNFSQGLPSKTFFQEQQRRAESYRNNYFALNAYERHKKLINDYVLYYPGSSSLLKRDSSKDKNDRDIIQEHHRFLWDDSEDANTWEKQLSKKYYDKLFKEYGLCDLSRYKENKVAIRWRTETEVVEGKGQFICGEKHCSCKESLRTWEVNFAYMEDRIKKNALVKLRLCTPCSLKLNFQHQKKEVTKKPKKRKSSEKRRDTSSKKKSRLPSGFEKTEEQGSNAKEVKTDNEDVGTSSTNIWKETVVIPDLKSREEEFDEYLDDLFL